MLHIPCSINEGMEETRLLRTTLAENFPRLTSSGEAAVGRLLSTVDPMGWVTEDILGSWLDVTKAFQLPYFYLERCSSCIWMESAMCRQFLPYSGDSYIAEFWA